MKQVLEIKLGQQLTLTPQLQQAIRLLQLSAQELAREIQEGLKNNPLLELTEEAEHSSAFRESPHTATTETSLTTPEHTDNHVYEESGISQYWSNIRNKQHQENFDDYLLELKDPNDQSIKAHLISQLNVISLTPRDRLIAETLIDMINEDGYCVDSLEDIQEFLASELADLDVDEIAAVLTLIQHFDPIGLGSQDLRQYLLLQLNQMPTTTPFLALAKQLISDNLEKVAQHDLKQLRQVTQCSEKTLLGALSLIKSLSPRPKSQLNQANPTYVIPNVIVSKQQDKWILELNNGITPAIQINKYYASILNSQKNSEISTQLKEQLQEARWLVKSLESRNETLLRVATCIISKQQNFLEHGDIAMKPLILQNIAVETGLHESTVSRITTQKYIQTPIGIYELKYFFSSHVSKDNGQECSSTAIRAFIKKIISHESKAKPFSDSKIAQILSAQQGINIARRTITKYREGMGIAASNLRRRTAQYAPEVMEL